LADVHAGVGAPGGIRVLDRAVDGIEAVDAVVAVADGGHVRHPVAVGLQGEHAVGGVVLGGQVLHDDAGGAEDPDAVVELELAVEDHLVAIEAADRDVVGDHVDRLVVGARADQHEVAGDGGVDRFGDRGVVVRHPPHARGPGFGRRRLRVLGGLRGRCLARLGVRGGRRGRLRFRRRSARVSGGVVGAVAAPAGRDRQNQCEQPGRQSRPM
jgi:hypothetical protein